MFKLFICFTLITSSLIINSAIASLEGTRVSVQNTIQAPFTEGFEVDFGNSQSTTVSSTSIELPSFVDVYDIDLSSDSISFNWVETDFSNSISGPVQANIFDRNYFVFSLPANTIISDISFDPTASKLLPGSAEPSAEIVSSNQVMTVFDEGVIRELGFNPVFKITTSTVNPAPIRPAHTGSWMDSEVDGRGGFINIADLGGQTVVVLSWSDYNDDGSQLWLVGNSEPLEVDASTATIPVQVTQQAVNGEVTKSDWGRFILEFNSCDTGTLIIEPNNGGDAQTVKLSRLTKIVGLSC
ncbi:MAG TPA: hypothetical protein ENJ32_12150 [Crenotrichaceae bacterium]|nr:hypothetical protein [Crenotrichaceae bacterium]